MSSSLWASPNHYLQHRSYSTNLCVQFIFSTMKSTTLAPLILSLTSATQYPLGQVPQQPFWINDGQDPVFVAETPISGLNTFASIGHAECLGAKSDDSDEARYDIAILGAPHDIVWSIHSILPLARSYN
jgi:hypothetical protein